MYESFIHSCIKSISDIAFSFLSPKRRRKGEEKERKGEEKERKGEKRREKEKNYADKRREKEKKGEHHIRLNQCI